MENNNTKFCTQNFGYTHNHKTMYQAIFLALYMILLTQIGASIKSWPIQINKPDKDELTALEIAARKGKMITVKNMIAILKKKKSICNSDIEKVVERMIKLGKTSLDIIEEIIQHIMIEGNGNCKPVNPVNADLG